MTQAMASDFRLWLEKTYQDEVTVQKAAQGFQQEFASYKIVSKPENTEECNKLVTHTAMTINKHSNSFYKNSTCLEPHDIEQIKNALKNYKCDSPAVLNIKNALIEDLTGFQREIVEFHNKNISEMKKERQLLEKQLRICEYDKHKLISDRLSKIMWPYDAKTKEFDEKISALQKKIEFLGQKIQQQKSLRPIADAKTVLLYELKLKEKFLKAS